jgi:hypothetical protein
MDSVTAVYPLEPTMQITGRITPNDYLNAQLLHMQPRPVVRILSFSCLIILLTGLFLFLLLLGALQRWPPLLALVSTVVLLFMLYRFLYLPWQVRRIYNQQKSLQLDFMIQFNDKGYYKRDELGKAMIPWDHIIKYKENNQLFIFYYSDALIEIIPKRLFATQEQLAILRKLLLDQHITIA